MNNVSVGGQWDYSVVRESLVRRRGKHTTSDLVHSVSEGRSLHQIYREHQVRDVDGCLGNKNGFFFHTLPGEGPGCGSWIAKNGKSLKTEDRKKNKYGDMGFVPGS